MKKKTCFGTKLRAGSEKKQPSCSSFVRLPIEAGRRCRKFLCKCNVLGFCWKTLGNEHLAAEHQSRMPGHFNFCRLPTNSGTKDNWFSAKFKRLNSNESNHSSTLGPKLEAVAIFLQTLFAFRNPPNQRLETGRSNIQVLQCHNWQNQLNEEIPWGKLR